MDATQIDALTRFVAQLGFPVASAVFLMWWITYKLNGKLDRIAEHMEGLPDRIADRLADKLIALLSRRE